MDPLEFIKVSRLLVSDQPSQEALRRALSTAYYTMFHALAESNANLLEGSRNPANQDRWTTVYRSLRHARVENMLHGWPHLFSPSVRDFADLIANMKRQRENADYNPEALFSPQEVANRINQAEQAIASFMSASPEERTLAAMATLAGQR